MPTLWCLKKKKKTKTLYSHLTGSRKKLQPDKEYLKKKKKKKGKSTTNLIFNDEKPNSFL